MDSTLIQQEVTSRRSRADLPQPPPAPPSPCTSQVIDELARVNGKYDEVAEITEQARWAYPPTLMANPITIAYY